MKSCLLEANESELDVVDELAECAAQGNRETTIAGQLIAVNVLYEQWVRTLLPLDHFRIKAVKEGIKKAHVKGCT